MVDGGGDLGQALVGEIMMSRARAMGVSGFVIDGAIRDVAAFQHSDFPCFARGVTHRGPYKFGPGEINVPVAVDGMVVMPGDVVLGDEDGVVTFDRAVAPELLALVRQQEAARGRRTPGDQRGPLRQRVLRDTQRRRQGRSPMSPAATIELSERIKRIKPSPSMVARDRARALRAQGRDIIDLTAGEPDFETPQHIKDAVVAALAAGETRYTPVNGTPALRQAIVAKLERENGVRYGLDQVTVGTGAKQVIYNALAATSAKATRSSCPRPTGSRIPTWCWPAAARRWSSPAARMPGSS